jgi:hypothetical protein
LPKRLAEKIESKFSEARREGGSAAGCVTDRTGAPGATPQRRISADLCETTEQSEPIPNQDNHFFGNDFWQGV